MPQHPMPTSVSLILTGLLFADEPVPAGIPGARHAAGRIIAVNDKARALGAAAGERAADAVRRIPALRLEKVAPEAGEDLARWTASLARAMAPGRSVSVIMTSPDEARLTITPPPLPEVLQQLEARLWTAGIRAFSESFSKTGGTALTESPRDAMTLASPSSDPARWRMPIDRLAALAAARSESSVRLVVETADGLHCTTEAAEPRCEALLAAVARTAPSARIVRFTLVSQPARSDMPLDSFIGRLCSRLGKDNVFMLKAHVEGHAERIPTAELPPTGRVPVHDLKRSAASIGQLPLLEPVQTIRLTRLEWQGRLTIERHLKDAVVARNPAGTRVYLRPEGNGWRLLGRSA